MPNFVPASVFRWLVDLETEKAIRLQYSVSVLCITPDSPAGSDGSALTAIAKIAASQLRATDVVTILSRSAIGMLLVDAEPRSLAEILKRAVHGIPPLFVGGQPSTWSGGAASCPQSAVEGRLLLHEATEQMRRARAEGGDRLYLTTGRVRSPTTERGC